MKTSHFIENWYLAENDLIALWQLHKYRVYSNKKRWHIHCKQSSASETVMHRTGFVFKSTAFGPEEGLSIGRGVRTQVLAIKLQLHVFLYVVDRWFSWINGLSLNQNYYCSRQNYSPYCKKWLHNLCMKAAIYIYIYIYNC